MGNFIDPRCSTPLFRITDSSLAKSCGKLSGYYASIFFTIFVSIIYGIYIFYLNGQYNLYSDIEKYNQRKQTSIIVFICVLVLIWIGVPIFTAYYNVKSWEGYQYQINEFTKDGLSRQAALDKLEAAETAKNLASSIRMSGRHRHH